MSALDDVNRYQVGNRAQQAVQAQIQLRNDLKRIARQLLVRSIVLGIVIVSFVVLTAFLTNQL